MKWPSWHPWGKWALFGILAGTAVMVMGSDEEHGPAGRAKVQQAAMASPRAVDASRLQPPVGRVEFERLLQQKRQSGGDTKIGNVFNATSWYVPPPPKPWSPPPPPEPMAPPLPFIYLGHYTNQDSPARIFILAWADRVYTVAEGDVIDGTYRIGAAADGLLEITYLPLNIRQPLNLGGMS